jgi:hypothetical protein
LPWRINFHSVNSFICALIAASRTLINPLLMLATGAKVARAWDNVRGMFVGSISLSLRSKVRIDSAALSEAVFRFSGPYIPQSANRIAIAEE